jgi:hypothetical protein
MNKPLVNILTRTSNRPIAFSLNKLSVRSQTYDNIRHIVSVDDELSEKYVKGYNDIDYITINKEDIIKNDKSVNPNTGKYSPHNLYFNELMSKVNGGWVMILDDDDRLSNSRVIETIMDKLTNEDTIAIFQMRFPGNIPIPSNGTVNQPPRIGNIGSPCFIFHSKYLKDLKWDGWKCGDFRFIEKVYNKIPNKVAIEKMLVTSGQIGDGKKSDL